MVTLLPGPVADFGVQFRIPCRNVSRAAAIAGRIEACVRSRRKCPVSRSLTTQVIVLIGSPISTRSRANRENVQRGSLSSPVLGRAYTDHDGCYAPCPFKTLPPCPAPGRRTSYSL